MKPLLDRVPPGERRLEWLEVTEMLDGSLLRIPVHVLHGRRDGPTAALVSTLHGAEWHTIDVLAEVHRRLDPGRLHGNVLILPVANPPAFGSLTRDTPGASDVADLNRVFPGGKGWTSLQMAKAITESVLAVSNFLVDLHSGPWGAAMENVGFAVDHSNPEVVERGREMALAYGVYTVREMLTVTAFPGPRSIAGYAGEVLGIPSLGVCVGGSGFDQAYEERWLDLNVRGILSVLRQVGICPEAEDRHLPEYLFSRGRGFIVNPQRSGLLEPLVSASQMNRQLPGGTLLARVLNPYTFEVSEELTLPNDGVLFGVPRHYPVRPGEWAYFAMDLSDPTTRVVRI